MDTQYVKTANGNGTKCEGSMFYVVKMYVGKRVITVVFGTEDLYEAYLKLEELQGEQNKYGRPFISVYCRNKHVGVIV